MSNKPTFIVAALIGGASIYCTNAVLDRAGDAGAGSDAGGISDANAGTEGCGCEDCPVEQPTILFDGDMDLEPATGGPCLGPELDVSAFRSIVVDGPPGFIIRTKHGEGAGYVDRGLYPSLYPIDTKHGTKIRVGGLAVNSRFCSDAGVTIGVTVVGYKNR